MRNCYKTIVTLLYVTAILLLTSQGVQTKEQNLKSLDLELMSFSTHPIYPTLKITVDSLGHTWLKGKIDEDLLHQEIVFQIKNAHIQQYELYVYIHDVLQKLIPSNQQNIKSRFPLYSFNTDKTAYYIKLQDNKAYNLPIAIESQGQYITKETSSLLKTGVYYGIVLMTILLSIVFFFVVQKRNFIAYLLLQTSLAFTLLFEEGFLYFITNGTLDLADFVIWNIPVTSMIVCFFMIYFLELKPLIHHFKTIFITLLSLTLVLCVLYNVLKSDALRLSVSILSSIAPFFCLTLASAQGKVNAKTKVFFVITVLIFSIKIFYCIYTYWVYGEFTWLYRDTFLMVSYIATISITFSFVEKIKQLYKEQKEYKNIENNSISFFNQQVQNKENLSILHQQNVLIQHIESLKSSYNLTAREVDVLRLIWNGSSNQEIADTLLITLSTTKYHISNLYNKLHIKNRNQALSYKHMNLQQIG